MCRLNAIAMNSTCKEIRLARNIKSFELTFDMSLHLMFMNYEILAVHFMPFWNLMQSANWPVNSKKILFLCGIDIFSSYDMADMSSASLEIHHKNGLYLPCKGRETSQKCFLVFLYISRCIHVTRGFQNPPIFSILVVWSRSLWTLLWSWWQVKF